VHAWTSNESEKHIGTSVLVLCVGSLDAELVRMCPGGSAGRALVVREPGEEPVVGAVLVVDLERHEQPSAEGNRGEDGTTAEDGDADADALHCGGSIMGSVGSGAVCRLTIKPKPAWK
jgi:hypothetical protein